MHNILFLFHFLKKYIFFENVDELNFEEITYYL